MPAASWPARPSWSTAGRCWRFRESDLQHLFQRRHADLRGAADRQDRLAELIGDLDMLAGVLSAGDHVTEEVIFLVVDPPAVLLDRHAQEYLAHHDRSRGAELVGELDFLLLELFLRRHPIASVVVELDSGWIRALCLRGTEGQRGRPGGRQRDDPLHDILLSSRDGAGTLLG